MNIGNFKKANGVIVGSITTLYGTLSNVAFEAITKEGNGPDYHVTANGCQLGAAWLKRAANGDDYFSISLSDPWLNRKVHCALFLRPDTTDEHVLVWSEPKKDGSKATAS
jgi:uncharacterized protein (DUF736 family)